MSLKTILKHIAVLILLGMTCWAIADNNKDSGKDSGDDTDLVIQEDKIFDLNKLTTDDIQPFEKTFNFDWNNHLTIEASSKKVVTIETFLQTNSDYSKLSSDDRQALGKILTKLGAYYAHILKRTDLAIEKIKLADSLLINKQEKAWNYDNLAYAYALKYADTDEAEDKDKSLYYSDKVITTLYHDKENKSVAFAYCVKAMVQNNAQDYATAESNFKKSLSIYETIPDGKDEQYARAKNQLANFMLEQNNQDKTAVSVLEELKQYWQKQGKMDTNPYAARNLISLGQAYLKTGDAKEACTSFNEAIAILQKVYGNDSPLLVEPYQDLADTYEQLGDETQVQAYLQKANQVDKS